MKHLDHSTIFVLIAGSFTPIALLALRPSWSVAMVSIAWAGALMGVLLTVAGLDHLHRAGLVRYLALGWLPIVAAAHLVRGLTFGELALLLGAESCTPRAPPCSPRNGPDCSPPPSATTSSGNAMVVGGGACHYTLILLLVRA